MFVTRIDMFVLLMLCVRNWDYYSFDANALFFVTRLSVSIAGFVTSRVMLLALLCF